MADIVRNDPEVKPEPNVAANPEKQTVTKEVPMPEGAQKAPNIQVHQGNVDLVTVKLLEAINNNLIQLKNAVLELKKNG